MINHFASFALAFSQSTQEDGTVAGEGLSAVETFTYFFAAPVVLFLVISLITYALTGERKKNEKNSSIITSID
ncbi:MAG: hypothetical protein O3B10_02630 [Actinomycetota bacterium]|nr:hypothetical protein [Actinomycetota bacterium]